MANRNSGSGLVKGFFLLCIGCVLIALGLSFGGNIRRNGWWPWAADGFTFNWDDSDDDTIREVVMIEDVFTTPVRDLDINLKAARLIIKSGPQAGYRATDFEKGAVRISLDGTRLRVDETEWRHSIKFGKNNLRPTLEITLPGDTTLDECKISVGAGSLELDALAGKWLQIESGAGSIKGTNIHAGKVVLKTGAGSLDFSSSVFADTDIETGAGRVAFEGDLTGRTDISTGAGSVELELSGKEDDYRIDFTRGIGSVRIGSKSFNGVGDGNAGNRDAERSMKLSTGVGSVRVSFQD